MKMFNRDNNFNLFLLFLIFLQNAVGGAERISALIGNELHANGYHVTYCFTISNSLLFLYGGFNYKEVK